MLIRWILLLLPHFPQPKQSEKGSARAAFRIVQCAALVFSRESSVIFSHPPPLRRKLWAFKAMVMI